MERVMAIAKLAMAKVDALGRVELADPSVTLTTRAGTRDVEALMIVQSGAKPSLVFTDAVSNMTHAYGFPGCVTRAPDPIERRPQVSRLARLFMITNEPAGSLRSIAASVR
jgi:hypothetical protein